MSRFDDCPSLVGAFDHWDHDALCANIERGSQEVVLAPRHARHWSNVVRATGRDQRTQGFDERPVCSMSYMMNSAPASCAIFATPKV